MLISPLIDLACAVGGPRFAHKVRLRRVGRWRTFEREYYLLDHLVDPTRVAVDVGANEGLYAGRLSQLTRSVHCFEPIPELSDALIRKLNPAVTVHRCAVSNQAGKTQLRIPYRGDKQWFGDATMEAGNNLGGTALARTIECDVVQLDDAISEPVGFVKIDVEGHEFAVLQGARRILERDKPILLIESERRHNKHAPENIFAFLRERGYAGLFLERWRLKGLAAYETGVHQNQKNLTEHSGEYICNFIFVPDSP